MSAPNEIIYMDAVLRPNQSLSQRGFAIVMAVVGGVSFLTGIAFISMGAIPVIGFFGLDALAFYFAFRMSFRQQREETRIVVTAEELRLTHKGANGSEKSATVPSAFARIELDEPLNANSWLRVEYGLCHWAFPDLARTKVTGPRDTRSTTECKTRTAYRKKMTPAS